jgi:cell division protein FtsI (penicillin-binding protein 3)
MNKTGRNRTRNAFNLRQRLKWVGLALGLCSVSLVGRAAYVQIINSARAKPATCASCPSTPRAA